MSIVSSDELFKGHGGHCGEHSTAGSHRAWCLQCAEWCYPRVPCLGCWLAEQNLNYLVGGRAVCEWDGERWEPIPDRGGEQ